MIRAGVMLALGLSLASCGGATSSGDNAMTAAQANGTVDDGKADCAIGINGAWAHDCPVERDGDRLTIRHPDGGFRRFHVLADGRGLESADGSEQAQLQLVDGDRVEIRIGGDRYRLPVKVAGQDQ